MCVVSNNLMVLCNCRVQSHALYLFSNNYKCNGNEQSLCECEHTEGYCPPSNTELSTVIIQCEEGVSFRHETTY